MELIAVDKDSPGVVLYADVRNISDNCLQLFYSPRLRLVWIYQIIYMYSFMSVLANYIVVTSHA